MIYISLILTFCSILFYKRILKSKKNAIIFSIIVFLSLLTSLVYFIINKLTGDGINESVLYHLTMDMGGAGISEFSELILTTLFFIIVFIIVSFITYRISLIKPTKAINLKHSKLRLVIAPLILLSAFIINPTIRESWDLYHTTNYKKFDGPAPEHYAVPAVIKKPEKLKNLVYIYLESFEATYLDENIFPDLTPNIKKLTHEGINFTDIRQIYGSGWTIAGMVNTQCAIPLVTPSGGNSMGKTDLFLPEALCLGDILAKQGYDLTFIQGSNLQFAGNGSLYKTHGFQNIKGFQELNSYQENSSYKSGWGLFDDTLFSYIENTYPSLLKKQPFGLFTINMDTHHPHGHESQFCKDKKYGDGDNPILNAVHCTDTLVYNLVEYIKSQSNYEDTIIVISSDHLAMPNSAYEQLKQGNRTNLLMIMGSSIKPIEITKKGGLIDVAPTILDALGFSITELGFGRSLLNNQQTLSESLDINQYLRENSNFVANLWGFPSIHKGLKIDSSTQQVQLENRTLQYPLAIILDEDLNTETVFFDGEPTLSKLMEQIDPQKTFVWVDSCTTLGSLSHNHAINTSDMCLALGSLNNKEVTIKPIKNSLKLSFKELKSAIPSENDEAFTLERIKKLKHFNKYGTAEIESLELPHIKNSYTIKSSGGFKQQSFIENNNTNEIINIARGLSLVGLKNDQTPEVIMHLDTCGISQEDLEKHEDLFKKLINDHSSLYDLFTIVEHDSAICDDKQLDVIFKKMNLSKWQKIAFRTPYIAIITKNGTYEYHDTSTESSIIININP